jgi:hypothetical protein
MKLKKILIIKKDLENMSQSSYLATWVIWLRYPHWKQDKIKCKAQSLINSILKYEIEKKILNYFF